MQCDDKNPEQLLIFFRFLAGLLAIESLEIAPLSMLVRDFHLVIPGSSDRTHCPQDLHSSRYILKR